MNVLIGCEFSGVIREAFRKRGHNAYSNDILPAEDGSRYHLQGDVLYVLSLPPGGLYLNSQPLPIWDLFIAHPPCTRLTNAGVRWLYKNGKGTVRDPEKWEDMLMGVEFFNACVAAKARIPRVAVENPIMHDKARDRIVEPYAQIIQPWQFGHKEMKATCLWLHNLPALVETDNVGPPPRDVVERRKWAKVHQMSPGPHRGRERSRFLPGIAEAMADQWGGLAR